MGIEGEEPCNGMLPRKSTIQVPEPLRLEMGKYPVVTGPVTFATSANCRVISLVRALAHSSQVRRWRKSPGHRSIVQSGETAGTIGT